MVRNSNHSLASEPSCSRQCARTWGHSERQFRLSEPVAPWAKGSRFWPVWFPQNYWENEFTESLIQCAENSMPSLRIRIQDRSYPLLYGLRNQHIAGLRNLSQESHFSKYIKTAKYNLRLHLVGHSTSQRSWGAWGWYARGPVPLQFILYFHKSKKYSGWPLLPGEWSLPLACMHAHRSTLSSSLPMWDGLPKKAVCPSILHPSTHPWVLT